MMRRTLIERLKSWASGEGSYRGPALGVSESGWAFSVPFGDGYQQGLTLSRRDAQNVATAYACVMVTAKAVAMCYPRHMRRAPDGACKPVDSDISRVLNRPNSYQTWPQYALNACAALMFEGESFSHIVRDESGAVESLHGLPPGACSPYVTESGDVFYLLGARPMEAGGAQFMAPARDVLHLRQYCPRHPLIGESPLKAAALALGINVALSANQAAFFSQMSRPSGLLTTESALTKDQMLQLRAAFDEQSKGIAAGKLPILGGGLKFTSLALTSQDSQLIEAQRMTIEEIARVLGVPLVVINGSTETKSNTEALINFWLATGLGSVIETIERSLDAAFDLPPGEFIELDTEALLRMQFAERVDGLAKAVQGGLMTPNEARARLDLGRVDGGDQVFLQQQMVGINLLEDLHAAEMAASIPAELSSTEEPKPPAETAPAMTEEQARALTLELIRKAASHE